MTYSSIKATGENQGSFSSRVKAEDVIGQLSQSFPKLKIDYQTHIVWQPEYLSYQYPAQVIQRFEEAKPTDTKDLIILISNWENSS